VLVGSLAVARLGRLGHKLVGASHATIPASAFGARFAEVRVDPELGVLRIARIVSVTDGGRIVNEKLARSQLIGGTVGGIGMATFEETLTDPGSGRVANATLADYLVPVNADDPLAADHHQRAFLTRFARRNAPQITPGGGGSRERRTVPLR
jgi:CO/xanthine dehydrogenase Mo-binding subunit